MKLVLLSGGSGKRLWPMSNDSRSKQFLKVLEDEQGSLVSMLQRVWSQLEIAGLKEDTYVCASKAQREIIEAQIGPIPFIEEPSRRDTFPAIALAISYLSEIVGCRDNEIVVVLPIDPMVDTSYFQSVKQLADVLEQSQCEMALLGVQPTEPSSKFGYINVKQTPKTGDWLEVLSFTEKPNNNHAAELIAGGALWNCGVFCFRVGYVKQVLFEQGYSSSYTHLIDNFDTLPKKSFDYEVVERTRLISVLPYTGKWKDLGTWESLSSEMNNSFVGLGTAQSCINTHVINELGIPVVTMGLQDAMVVAAPDGILVADKSQSASMKSLVEMYGSRPMFEERRWGSYRVLDYQKMTDGTEVLTKLVQLLPGKNLSYHKHLLHNEVWTIIGGRGEIILDSKITQVQAGDVLRIHNGQWHAIHALENLSFIEVQRGTELLDSDVLRRNTNWMDIVSLPEVLI